VVGVGARVGRRRYGGGGVCRRLVCLWAGWLARGFLMEDLCVQRRGVVCLIWSVFG